MLRMMTTKTLRCLLAEYRELLGQGRKTFDEGMKGVLEWLTWQLPASPIDVLRGQ